MKIQNKIPYGQQFLDQRDEKEDAEGKCANGLFDGTKTQKGAHSAARTT